MGKFVIRQVSTGYTFRLKARNGEVIATSEAYSGETACRKGIASVAKNAPIAGLQDMTDTNAAAVSNPKFEVYLDKAQAFRFRLKAKNGETIAVSEGYTSKQACLNGIESVRKNAVDADIIIEDAT